ncbi:MAG: hypothetical protein GW795_02070 [Cyanobacteria bacterium]|nr:hypothetical protein [Cyanobacteria bacterium CG_2015-16_32_12]NCO77998.1 hypothetical protein [Cyanobacteria bacterium CG_2015-22_32_23]NCQ03983.1 hypothetical protein [Cyanobacteria bacterium CG_2015-09_32_10]NCQ40689.1 hypothetical protein [Cyanobacteria bacterium CG_2015-04_32_10]NCS85518.1 hypothetical protein [Cyanobacteria bacterium CG_2015-02_32_10]
MKKQVNTMGILLIFLFSLIGIAYLQLPMANQKKENLTKVEALRQQEKEGVKINLLKNLPDFGFNNLVADWIYLQFIQYFGDRARDYTGYSLNPEYFRGVVDKDPRFISPYFILAPATSLFSGRPDISVELMAQGLESISPEQPKAYQVWFYKGIDELLFVGKPEDAQKSYEMAVKWAKYHNDAGSKTVARQAEETANFLEKNPDSKKAQAAAWMGIFANAREDVVRDLALRNIKRLGGNLVVSGNKASLSFPTED